MIDITKVKKTRGGLAVTDLTVCAVSILGKADGIQRRWHIDGSYGSFGIGQSVFDLIEEPDQDFKSDVEMYRYLVDGGKIISNTGCIVFFNEAGNFNNQGWNFEYYENWKKYIEPAPWYEAALPGKVLCWYWDIENKKHIGFIIEYENSNYPFISSTGTHWKNAIPVKL